MEKSLNIFIFLGLCLVQTHAQTTFNHRYPLGHPSCFLTGIEVTDSCYYAVGSGVSPQMNQVVSLFAKFNLDGEPVFAKEHSVPGAWLHTNESAMVRTGDHLFAAAGIVVDSVRRAYLLKLDAQGDTVFTRTYLHPSYPATNFLYIFDLALTADGGFLIVGNMNDAQGNPDTDILAIRTDSLGNEVWKKGYGGDLKDFGTCAIPDGTGEGHYIGGVRNNTNVTVEGYTFQAQFLHIDGEGNVDWEYLTPNSYLSDRARDMVMLDDGSLVVASGVGTEIDQVSVNTVDFQKSLFKLTPEDEIEWEVLFPSDEPVSTARTEKIVRLSNESGFVVAGADAEDLPGNDTYIIRGWLAKVSNSGNKVWERRYIFIDNQNSRHWFYDMKECPDGGLILCGEARDATGQDSIPQQAWLLKLDAQGCLIPGCHLLDAAGEAGMPELELAIYPNPTTDYLNFQLRGGDVGRTASFRIVDLQGRVVRTFESGTPGATHIVPVWDWGAGVYFLQSLEDGNVRASEKFVVSN